MESSELTTAQLDSIKARVDEQRAYFRRLVARMEARRFLPDDRLLVEARDVLRLDGLWMTCHYLGCGGQTGNRQRAR